MALASLLVYLGTAVWGTATPWPLPVMLLSTGFLWATCVLVTWSSLRSHQNLDDVAAGVAMLLLGVVALRARQTLLGVAMLLLAGRGAARSASG